MRNYKFSARELAMRWLNQNAYRAHGLLGEVTNEDCSELDIDPDGTDTRIDFTEPQLIVVRFWVGDYRVPISGISWTQLLHRVKAVLPELGSANAIAEKLSAERNAADKRVIEERIAWNRAFEDALPELVKTKRGKHASEHARAIAR